MRSRRSFQGRGGHPFLLGPQQPLPLSLGPWEGVWFQGVTNKILLVPAWVYVSLGGNCYAFYCFCHETLTLPFHPYQLHVSQAAVHSNLLSILSYPWHITCSHCSSLVLGWESDCL